VFGFALARAGKLFKCFDQGVQYLENLLTETQLKLFELGGTDYAVFEIVRKTYDPLV